jgi:hypothetical protein
MRLRFGVVAADPHVYLSTSSISHLPNNPGSSGGALREYPGTAFNPSPAPQPSWPIAQGTGLPGLIYQILQ